MQQIDVTIQFVKAVEAVNASGVSVAELCRVTGIDRRNLCRLINDPEHHYPRPQWLAAVCSAYGVRPAFLLMDRGGVFHA